MPRKVKGDIFYAKARKYPTSLAAALSGDNVPEGVYRTLVAETNKGLPQLHRYFELRRRMLGLPDMAYYDIYPPLVQLDRTFTLDEMRTHHARGGQAARPGLWRQLRQGDARRKWMDPLPRPGKQSGAYMNPGAYDVHPYLLLNLSENYDGLTTYAHEWGHAMHTLLANEAQPLREVGLSDLHRRDRLDLQRAAARRAHGRSRRRPRRRSSSTSASSWRSIRGTFYRQTMFAEFELAAHDAAEAGEGLSGEKFSAIYLDLLKRYHGPKVALDPAYGIEWAYIPHFYNSFYVYQYATCISAASYFARRSSRAGPKERDNYLAVLKAGGSDYPVDILKRAGLDMTTPAPYQALVATFKDTLDQAEALLA